MSDQTKAVLREGIGVVALLLAVLLVVMGTLMMLGVWP